MPYIYKCFNCGKILQGYGNIYSHNTKENPCNKKKIKHQTKINTVFNNNNYLITIMNN